MSKYFKSEQVKIFPNAFRNIKDGSQTGTQFNVEARLNTEYNLTHLGTNNLNDNTYIIEWKDFDKDTNSTLRCIIGGYYFEINEIEKNFFDDLITENTEKTIYLRIQFKDQELVATPKQDTKLLKSWQDETTNLDYYNTSDEKWYFTGIKIENNNNTGTAAYSLPIMKITRTGSGTTEEPYVYTHKQVYTSYLPTWKHGQNEFSVMFGSNTTASGKYSVAEGTGTIASGDYSHAEGSQTVASGTQSHAEGQQTKASGSRSHAEGNTTSASNDAAHAEGEYTKASNKYSHAEGYYTTASGESSHAEGRGESTTISVKDWSTTDHTITMNSSSHGIVEGNVLRNTIDNEYKYYRVISVSGTTIQLDGVPQNKSNWFLIKGIAHSDCTHAEGYNTTASGPNAHVEGNGNIASGENAHAEGYQTKATGNYAHTEGWRTEAKEEHSHAEGYFTKAYGKKSHTEGDTTIASGLAAHSEGDNTAAIGNMTHAEGWHTIANRAVQHVFGEYNIADTSIVTRHDESTYGNYVEIVGNGNGEIQKSTIESPTRLLGYYYKDPNNKYVLITSSNCQSIFNEPSITIIYSLSNARTLDWSGNEWLAGDFTVGGIGKIGSSLTVGSKLTAKDELEVKKDITTEENIKGTTTSSNIMCGANTDATNSSIAVGNQAKANGTNSQAFGCYALASSEYQLAFGKNNIEDKAKEYVEIVGNGASYKKRANARTLDWSGNEWLAGSLQLSDSATLSEVKTHELDLGSTNNNDAGAINLYGTSNTTVFTVRNDGAVVAASYNATSDRRLKENIIDYKPEKSILDLPVKKFDFINGTKNNIGCLAQDLQEICPEIVHENENGYLSIEESKLVYLLLDEVKKLRKELDEIKNK